MAVEMHVGHFGYSASEETHYISSIRKSDIFIQVVLLNKILLNGP